MKRAIRYSIILSSIILIVSTIRHIVYPDWATYLVTNGWFISITIAIILTNKYSKK